MKICLFSLLILFLFNNGIIIKSKRRDDGGNLKNVSYNCEIKKIRKKKLREHLIKSRYLDMSIRGMACIEGCDKYKLGTIQNNIMAHLDEVKVEDFLIDKTVLTVEEFNKYLKILCKYYKKIYNKDIAIFDENENNEENKNIDTVQQNKSKIFMLSDEDLYNKFAKSDKNKIDIDFEKHVKEYLNLRKSFEEKISKEYIYDMIPWMSNKDDKYNKTLKDFYKNQENKNKPAIGLNWEQCMEIAILRTVYINEYLSTNLSRKNKCLLFFTLPTYKQWCYAAECGDGNICLYGWGSISLTNKNGEVCGNFNNINYNNENIYVSDVKKYEPNNNGLYDMSGNVWEWLIENDNTYLSNNNNIYLSNNNNNNTLTKMIVGGSYASSPNELEIGIYHIEHIYESKPNIGVRFVANLFF